MNLQHWTYNLLLHMQQKVVPSGSWFRCTISKSSRLPMNRKVGRVTPRPAEPEPKHLPLLHPMEERAGRGDRLHSWICPLPTPHIENRPQDGARDSDPARWSSPRKLRDRNPALPTLLHLPAGGLGVAGRGEEKHARKNLAENDRIQPIRLERAAADPSQRRGDDTAPYRPSRFPAPIRVQILEVRPPHEPERGGVQRTSRSSSSAISA